MIIANAVINAAENWYLKISRLIISASIILLELKKYARTTFVI